MMKKLVYKVEGMDCADEVAALKREIGPVVGGEDKLSFDILHGKMTVEADPQAVSTESILKAVARAGMRAEPWNKNTASAEKQGIWRHRGRLILTGTSGLFLLAGFLAHVWLAGSLAGALGVEGTGLAHVVPFTARVLYLLSIMTGVRFVLAKAWSAARRLRPDMNLLMIVAVAGAIIIGEWFEAAMVAFLFSVSLLLESWSVGRARRAVESLLEAAPLTVHVRQEDGAEKDVDPEKVAIGSLFVVRPGEKIPLDGRVLRGSSDVNQAPITGESIPIAKARGDEVFAGAINGNGVIEIESTKTADRTTLAHIIRMVGEAQSRRAPSEQWVEKFARYYTPAVMALAMAVFLIPPLLMGGAWADWFYRALVLLVIACPCALVISTPVSIVSALAASAHNGILVKGGVYMEEPAHLKAIAFDKTGTLTEGRPRVVKLVALNGHNEAELLERAAALEAGNNHPLGRAIIEEAQKRNIPVRAADNFRIIPGKGASGRFKGKSYWLGSHRYLEEREQETPEVHELLETLSDAGHTAVVVGTDDHVCGLIALADAPRFESFQTIQRLRDAGLKHIVMLTGDNKATARAVGRELGIDEVHAELLPEDKVAAVESLVTKYNRVAMVGDGVNDAPAMGRATLGIAMGAAGSDAAIETADIALMSDDLSRLPWLISHSRHTLKIIRENICLALTVKAAFVLFTLIGYASLWAAIAADTGASLIVIFNGLRLLGGNRRWGTTITRKKVCQNKKN